MLWQTRACPPICWIYTTHPVLGIERSIVNNNFRGAKDLESALVLSPGLWPLAVALINFILPRCSLWNVDVRRDILSLLAVRMYFKYTNSVVETAIRLSERLLAEWHAIATIAKLGDKEFSPIVPKSGDWRAREREAAYQAL